MKTFKKLALLALATTTLSGSLSSCATVFGGPVTAYQKTKPAPGAPQRDLRIGALVADVLLFWPGTVVDFATGAIYKPLPRTVAAPAMAAPAAAPATTVNKK